MIITWKYLVTKVPVSDTIWILGIVFSAPFLWQAVNLLTYDFDKTFLREIFFEKIGPGITDPAFAT